MPKSGGFDQLGGSLFSGSPDLQVTARRRYGLVTTVAVPAGGTNNFFSSLVPAVTDILQAGDGFLFDKAQVWMTAAASGVVLNSISLFVQDLRGLNAFPIGQPVATLSAIAPAPAATFDLTPTPNLWTSIDLNSVLALTTTGPGIGPIPPQPFGVAQPIQFRVAGFFSNSSAGAITVTINCILFLRIVRGLQEG